MILQQFRSRRATRYFWVRRFFSTAVGLAASVAGVFALIGGDRIGVLFLIFGLPLFGIGLAFLWLGLLYKRSAASANESQP
jgi:hypothetical protein